MESVDFEYQRKLQEARTLQSQNGFSGGNPELLNKLRPKQNFIQPQAVTGEQELSEEEQIQQSQILFLEQRKTELENSIPQTERKKLEKLESVVEKYENAHWNGLKVIAGCIDSMDFLSSFINLIPYIGTVLYFCVALPTFCVKVYLIVTLWGFIEDKMIIFKKILIELMPVVNSLPSMWKLVKEAKEEAKKQYDKSIKDIEAIKSKYPYAFLK